MGNVQTVAPRIDSDKKTVIECRVVTSRFDGEVKYPGRARAWLVEVAPDDFAIIPFSMKELGGYHIQWCNPQPSQPISTKNLITSRTDASVVFGEWAQREYVDNRESTGTRATREIREALDQT